MLQLNLTKEQTKDLHEKNKTIKIKKHGIKYSIVPNKDSVVVVRGKKHKVKKGKIKK